MEQLGQRAIGNKVAFGSDTPVRGLVINFNGPELNHLALSLARESALAGFVRPYVNKGRRWERVLEAMPLAGNVYRTTFGRRKLQDPQLNQLTFEAGVGPDLIGSALGRATWIPAHLRHRWVYEMQEAVRSAVTQRGAALADGANCIVAYPGFALDAFATTRLRRDGKSILNYSIAHHLEHRRMWQEECEREPAFASTWLGFDHWKDGYEAQLDQEIASADGILVGSEYAKETFRAAGISPNKVRVIPYGVDPAIFTPPAQSKRRDERFEVVYAGQLTQRKGISYLLRGYRKFQKRDSRLTLIGELVSGMEPFLPFADDFRHVPHLTRPALAAMYAKSSVLVFPSLFEGMGLVVLEAMACGLPVIVSTNGPNQVVRDGIDGFIIPIRDEDAICDRLQRLYDDPEMCEWMGSNARQRAVALSWNQYAREVTSYMAEMVNLGHHH